MSIQGYLRHPTIRGDTIVFVCDDDLWAVGAAGGIARRLTAGLGEPSFPAISPDGRFLAYVGRDEKHPEVYLMAAEGGPARRMTWLGPEVMVRGWTPEGRIVFVTTHGQPFFRHYQACTLGVDGGLPELLPYGQVNHLAFGPRGARVIGRNTADPARWKRYRGGTAGHLWVDPDGSGTFHRLPALGGNLTCPMWIGERVWFLSDHEGWGNLYSCLPDGRDVTRHTDHDVYYARHASSDGARIVYQCGADLWLFDPAHAEAHRLDILAPSHRTQASRRFVAAEEYVDGFALHPDGHSLVVDARGKLFSFALWEGAVREHGEGEGARHRLGQWLADGRTLVAVSDATGEERIHVFEPIATTPASPGRKRDRRTARAAAARPDARHRHEAAAGARGASAFAGQVAGQPDPAGAQAPTAGGAAGPGSAASVGTATGPAPVVARSRIIDADIGRVVALVASPVGRRLAFANHRNEVAIADVDAGTVVVVDRSDAGRAEHLAWSPDGAWLAYPFWVDARHTAIKLCEVATGRTLLATVPEFRDFHPAFDPEGRYLYFLSFRTFDPVYDNVQFELSFPRGARPYLVALQAGGSPPFDPEPRGLGDDDDDDDEEEDDDNQEDDEDSDDEEEDDDHDDDSDEKPRRGDVAASGPGAQRPRKERKRANRGDSPSPVRVDVEGIERRVAAFPVPEGLYHQIAGIEGKVLWTVFPIAGAHGRGGHKEGPGRLESFDLESVHLDTLVDKIDEFTLSADCSTLVIREEERLRALEAGKKPDDDKDDDSGHPEFSRKTGWIDLGRIRLSVDPQREWRQMLREVWRLQRDQFWVPDMSGVDWEAAWRRYEPLLARVSTRGELSDLIWELQGELGTSHAYEYEGDYRKPPQLDLGMLAADFRYDEATGGYAITHLVRGDPWDAESHSPLDAVGVEAREGEVVLAVNGRAVTRETPPQALLVHQAGCKAEVILASADGKARRAVLVTLLKDETAVRYREWVERNRRRVHDGSNGRIGYLHLPDMQSAGFAEFHRYFTAECDRDGLIVDVRYNRGGHVSQLLLEKLARQRIGYDFQRWGKPLPYPAESPAGPVVALTNEHAGSDGDIFSHCFKLMRLGPLVGKRTWGGVVGIWPRHALVDGTETTQPEFSFWFVDVGWAVENYGTDPDVDVDNAPHDYVAGRDRQLEKALDIALARIERPPTHAPSLDARPLLAVSPLPPRARTS